MPPPSLSLSSLCSICHANTPRYKCPRCFTRTCSLQCTKLHKARTLCSGVRDPGTFATRKQLNAPESFDRDFNFISGVERGIERAGRDAEHRGTLEAGGPTVSNARSGPGRGEVPLRKSLEADGITVVRAPKGMQISRLNNTHWRRKGGGVSWTVMWHFGCWPSRDAEVQSSTPQTLVKGLFQCHESIDLGQGFLDFYDDFWRKNDAKGLMAVPDIKRDFIQLKRRGADSTDTTADGNGDVAPPCQDQSSQENQQEADILNEQEWNFLLEAPDKTLPGVTAAIPFDGLDKTLTLKDLLRGRTIRECPHIWVCKGTLPPKTLHVLEPFKRETPQNSQKVHDEPAQTAGVKRPRPENMEVRASKETRIEQNIEAESAKERQIPETTNTPKDAAITASQTETENTEPEIEVLQSPEVVNMSAEAATANGQIEGLRNTEECTGATAGENQTEASLEGRPSMLSEPPHYSGVATQDAGGLGLGYSSD